MTTIGIICEYNPFHNGHAFQIRKIREKYGAESAVICLMSGNYVQRGEPAIFSKEVRAKAALMNGADLVLELPLTVSIRSAEGFAFGGVKILNQLGCDVLCFGSESGKVEKLMEAAKIELESISFHSRLISHLSCGFSYPKARDLALHDLGTDDCVKTPNDILGVEYCKALIALKSNMIPMVLRREGDYHNQDLDPDYPSASAVRQRMESGGAWKKAVPENLNELYEHAQRYSTKAGERSVLARVRTQSEEAFQAMDSGKEGIWCSLMNACRSETSIEEIYEKAKTRRYTRTRLQRMLMGVYLGVSQEQIKKPEPYVRILGFTDRGREVLRIWKNRCTLVNAGQTPPDPAYFEIENRAADLYQLFSEGTVKPCGEEKRLRVIYQKSSN